MANNFVTRHFPSTVNGDNIIAFTDAKKIKGSIVENDASTLARWYAEDPDKNYKGMLNILSNATDYSFPILNGIFKDAGVINVNGVNGTFTFGVPVFGSNEVVITEDTSTQSSGKIGADNSLFRIVANAEFKSGDVLTYDRDRGCQVIVSNDVRPRKISGSDWELWVRLLKGSRAKFYPKDKLRKGVRLYKIGHAMGEFSTQYSSVSGFSKMGELRCEYTLGSLRGVEGEVTRFAGDKLMSYADSMTQNFVESSLRKIHAMSKKYDMDLNLAVFGSSVRSDKGFSIVNMKVAHLMEIFCLAELEKMSGIQHLFQRGGEVMDNNGVIRINEGAYHQLRRGPQFHYSRPGGISLSLLQEISDFMYRNFPEIPVEKRRIKFHAGHFSKANMDMLLREFFYDQLHRMSGLLGKDMLIKNPIQGSNESLSIHPVSIGEAFVPGVGMVSCVEEPSLNYTDMVDRMSMIDGMTPYSAYSMFVEMDNPNDTNPFQSNIGNYKSMLPGLNKDAYIVKPEGPAVFWGYERGRWSSSSSTGEVINSSMHLMAEQFWCNSASSVFLPNPDKYLLVELT